MISCWLSRRIFSSAAFVTVTGAAACTSLPEIAPQVCGNGVVEPGEDCDSFAEAGKSCGASTEAEDRACHYQCTLDGTLTCPEFSACGIDGICRYSNTKNCQPIDDRLCQLSGGVYLPLGPPLPVPAQNIELGDFDGDGRKDLLTLGNANTLWQSYPRIQFFDETGQAGNVFDPRIAISSPDIVQLAAQSDANTSAPRHQVVFSSNYGIGIFDSDANRAVLPIAFPIQQLPQELSYRMARVKGTSEEPYHESVIIFINNADGAAPFGYIQDTAGTVRLAPAPDDIQRLLDDPSSGDVIDGPDSPCDEVMFAFSGNGHVYMLKACGDASGDLVASQDAVREAVTLSGSHTVGASPLLGAIDPGNSQLDVLIVDEAGAPYVAFGDGTGNFFADPSDPATLASAWPVSIQPGIHCPLGLPVDSRFPLALGDLNQDGLADWISPGGIQLTESVVIDAAERNVLIFACAINAPFVGTWSVAKVADLNRDGLLDVVAGSFDATSTAQGTPELDFLEGTGFDLLNPSGIITHGPTKHMVVGDFDGDLVNDVAFSEHELANSSGGQAIDRLAIAFGSLAGPPSAPIEIGQFSSVTQLLAGKYAGQDSIDELGVIAQTNNVAGQQLSLFIGSPGRHPFAPLGLSSISRAAELNQSPLASVVADAVLDSKIRPSILAVGGDCSKIPCDFRFWLVPSVATGGFGAPMPSPPLPTDFIPYRFKSAETSVFVLVSDSESTTVSEVYAVTGGADDKLIHLWRVQLPESLAAWEAPVVVPLGTIAGQLSVTSNPTLVDLDADGDEDLALIAVTEQGLRRLTVLWNDGTAPNPGLDPSIVDIQGDVWGFSLRRLGALTGLVATTDSGTYSIVGAVPGARPPSVQAISGLPGGTSLGVGDVTGDGLDDFAITVPGGVQLFAEQAVQR